MNNLTPILLMLAMMNKNGLNKIKNATEPKGAVAFLLVISILFCGFEKG